MLLKLEIMLLKEQLDFYQTETVLRVEPNRLSLSNLKIILVGFFCGLVPLLFLRDQIGRGGFMLFLGATIYIGFYGVYLFLVDSKTVYEFDKSTGKIYRTQPYFGEKELMNLNDGALSAYRFKNVRGYRFGRKENSTLGKYYRISPTFRDSRKGNAMALEYEEEILMKLQDFFI